MFELSLFCSWLVAFVANSDTSTDRFTATQRGARAVRAAAATLPFGSRLNESRLAVIRQVPEFALTDQGGETVGTSDLRGKVWLVSFIFTTCNGSCPATTHRMGQVQQELKSRGLMKDDRVRLVSITLDPARDTPEVLLRYMQLYDADAKTWSFLTGPAADVDKTITSWDMWVRPTANGQLDHPSRIFLVDGRGRAREIYNLSFLNARWVADDVELLLDEAKR